MTVEKLGRQRIHDDGRVAMSASTSSLVGVRGSPVSREASTAAAAVAKVTRASKSRPLASAIAYAPWKASPHPVVSTTGDANAGV